MVANESPVGEMLKPGPTLKENGLEDLTRHRRAGNIVSLEKANMGTDSSNAHWLNTITNLIQLWIGVPLDRQAKDLVTIFLQTLGDQNWESSPTRNQSNFFTHGYQIPDERLNHPDNVLLKKENQKSATMIPN